MTLKLRKLRLRLQRFFGRFSAMQIIVLVFLAMILAGSGLLMLPVSSRSRAFTPFLTALFTATSCTCVTGLALVDTFTHWSGFGQAVMLVLIQIGGLGFMTIISLFFFAVHRKIGLKQRLLMAQSLGLDSLSGVVSMVRLVLRRTLIVEGASVFRCRSEQRCGGAYFILSPPSAMRALTSWAPWRPAAAWPPMWGTRW